MPEFEALIKMAATGMGVVAIAAPVFSVMRGSGYPHGRSTGRGAASRTWPVVLLMAVGFVALGFVLWRPLPFLMPAPVALTLSTLGAIFYFPGAGLYLWGFATLGSQFRVSGILGAELYREHRLITHGPYAVIRHPMYAGVLLAALGATLIFRTWAMAIFLPISLVVVARAGREEALLAEEFTGAWEAYMARVPKWIPGWRKGTSREIEHSHPVKDHGP
jgi:protein-S-isoprenylcysteine O-methyltransferase Ste14